MYMVEGTKIIIVTRAGEHAEVAKCGKASIDSAAHHLNMRAEYRRIGKNGLAENHMKAALKSKGFRWIAN